MVDLEQLRESVRVGRLTGSFAVLRADDLSALLDEIDRLQREIERKDKALQPFARFNLSAQLEKAPDAMTFYATDFGTPTEITVGDVRRARAALSSNPSEPQQ